MKVTGTARTAAAGLCALALAGCQTTKESEWTSARGGTPFDQAEKTCEIQQEFIAEEAARPGFFVKCMAAFDWTPEAGRAPTG